MENLNSLVKSLCEYTDELPWLEFKHNNYNPEMIGEDISALANGATLHGRDYAYFIWGIDDQTHEIIGTDYDLQKLKKGNQELENWLRGLLSDNADFQFDSTIIEGKTIGVMKIYGAVSHPVSFKDFEYIRVGSYTKKLKDHPSLQTRLWSQLNNRHFETSIALKNISKEEIITLLDYRVYFELTQIKQPSSIDGILHYMEEEKIVILQDDGYYSITNMGALLFASKWNPFPELERKAMRIIQYKGTNRIELLKEWTIEKGYASGFNNAIQLIEALLPSREIIVGALRQTASAYPSLAVREIIANALIHQDFSIRGTGVMIEIFANRIEITNPGLPLVDIYRIIDNPPRSRNEKLASLMRRLKMCEELGTGWDKITMACENQQLPAPKIELYDENTKVILYSAIPFAKLSLEDKLWACYLHACLLYVQGEQLTNKSLRIRFGLPDSSSGSVSRLIKEAVAKNLIKPVDSSTSNKYMKYIPIWG